MYTYLYNVTGIRGYHQCHPEKNMLAYEVASTFLNTTGKNKKNI